MSDQASIVGLYDPEPYSLIEAQAELNPNARIYADMRSLVRSEEVDWVAIGSWNSFHAEQALEAIQAGKHIFIEKPLATSLEDCIAIRDACEASGCHFIVGFTLRFSPHFHKLKELIESGIIGRVVSMEFNETLAPYHGALIMGGWRRHLKYAGSFILEKCCHDLDLVNWLLCSRARRVASFGGRNVFIPENSELMERFSLDEEGHTPYNLWTGKLETAHPFKASSDILDNQVVIIEYENGVRASFHTNCHSAIPERRMYILGTKGTLRTNVLDGSIEYQLIGEGESHIVNSGVSGGHGDGDSHIARELLAAMLWDTPASAGIVDGVSSAVTAFGIDEAESSGTVVDMAPYWAHVDRRNFAGSCSPGTASFSGKQNSTNTLT